MFPNNFLLRHVKRGTNTIPMLRSILLGLLVLSWSDVVLAASNDGSKTHRATVCYKSGANQEELSIVCPGGYIQIIGAFYGHNSNGCENPTENGECDQTSKIVTTELSTKCNDKLTCSYKPPTIASVNGRKLSGLEIDANPTQCSESRTLELEGRHRPVNEFGAHYKCKEYRICQKLDVSLSGLVMQTENYPELITTNPTCECTYGVEAHGGQFLELTMSCEGQVTVLTEEFDASSKQLTKEEYFCSDDPHFLIGDVKESSRIHFKVDVSRSSEMSAYKIKTDIYRPGGYKLKDGKVSISCVEGSLYLRYSVRLALFIVIPLIVIIIIALIVFRCCLKRRKEEKKWERQYLAARNTQVDAYERQEIAADGKSTSTTAEPEPWHSNPEVSPMNELERESTPRRVGSVRTYLHRSHTAIPSIRGDNIGDPRLSRSRHSVRSLNKRRAPRPPGPPPPELLVGTAGARFLQPNRNIRGDDIEMDVIKRRPVEASAPSDEDLQYAGSDTDNRGQLSHSSSDARTPLIINTPPQYTGDSETDSLLSARRRNTDFDPGDTGETLILPRNNSVRSREGSVGSAQRHDIPSGHDIPERHQVRDRTSSESDGEMTIMRPGMPVVDSDAAFSNFDPSISAPDEYDDQVWMSDDETRYDQPEFAEAGDPGYDEATGGYDYNNDYTTFSKDLDY